MPRRKRNWAAAGSKCLAEGRCRVCGTHAFEMAHVLGRTHDDREGWIDPLDIVPLCGPFPEGCHGRYDRHQLDLTDFLTKEEIERAVHLVGPYNAAIRIRGMRDPQPLPGDYE